MANLPSHYKADLYFHNFDERLFNNLILDSIGRYNLYVITSIVNDVYAEILDRLDSSKVLIVDLGKFKKDKFSYICQGFDATLYECLLSGLESLKKYKKINFIFPESCEHPKSCIADFEKFCKDYGFEYCVQRKETLEESDLTKDGVYLFAKHSDLIKGIKICRNKGWALGKDIGFIVLNDTPMLEVIENGISTISTDFKQMGRLTAEYIVTRNKIQAYVPTKLILRGSL
jgi:DNA-binding LacI/PurR family transcriptional regulator